MTTKPKLCIKCQQNPGSVEDPNYAGMCAGCAWKEWFDKSGNKEFWDNVECIECELGRDCSKHPEN